MNTETNRLEILNLMNEMVVDNETLYKLDMWNVSVVMVSPFGVYETRQALFRKRADAEEWLSYVTKGRPFYAYCCDRKIWNRVEELLSTEHRAE